MKRIFLFVLVICISIIVNSASIDYLMNNSAAYLGNPSQAGIISADGAFYNPAGLTQLEDGTYININGLFSGVEESMIYPIKSLMPKIIQWHRVLILCIKKIKVHFILIPA
ncbi:MAG: hypothetical protein LBV03_04000 [Fusobacteriales bacterium]|jgi:long-chain fatty acid transport protein|nr:hypothetical protein [Fusobacteriales bacterium]